jgi:hypothetical protein
MALLHEANRDPRAGVEVLEIRYGGARGIKNYMTPQGHRHMRDELH